MNLIPDKIQPYAKAAVATVGTVATAVVALIPQLPAEVQAPLAVVLAVATSVATYWVPNIEKFIDDDDYTPQDADVAVDVGADSPVSEAQDGDGVVPDTPVVEDGTEVPDDNPTDAE